jgi:hypothetical protein
MFWRLASSSASEPPLRNSAGSAMIWVSGRGLVCLALGWPRFFQHWLACTVGSLEWSIGTTLENQVVCTPKQTVKGTLGQHTVRKERIPVLRRTVAGQDMLFTLEIAAGSQPNPSAYSETIS